MVEEDPNVAEETLISNSSGVLGALDCGKEELLG